VSADGRADSADRPDRRLLLVRLLDPLRVRRATRAPGPVHRRVSTWLGRDPERFSRVTECRQCGEWESVNVFRLSGRQARYWCQSCGATVSLAGVAALRPVGELPATAPAGVPAPGAAATGVAPELRELLPLSMVRSFGQRLVRPITVARLDKSVIYQLHARWDAKLRRATPAQLAELAVADTPPPVPGLPAFSTVVTALHNHCYRAELVFDALLPSLPGAVSPEAAQWALWERVEQARRWLAVRGSAECWVHATPPGGEPPRPDERQVRAAVAALRDGRQPSPEVAAAARVAMFGTDRGPTLARLRRGYSPEEMVDALAAYLAAGERPLRDDMLARLAAPFTGDRRPPERVIRPARSD
jgi:hypothetical protein